MSINWSPVGMSSFSSGESQLATGGAGGTSAIDTELSALRQQITKDIEMSFKTFA